MSSTIAFFAPKKLCHVEIVKENLMIIIEKPFNENHALCMECREAIEEKSFFFQLLLPPIPQSVFTALTYSLQDEWQYNFKVMPSASTHSC